MPTKPLRRWSTDELETAIYSGRLDNVQRYEAERILSERERAPERRLRAPRLQCGCMGARLLDGPVALIILWLLAAGDSLP
jgi:hypothetical protein